MTAAPATPSAATPVRPAWRSGWPLAAAVATLVVGVILGTRETVATVTPGTVTVLLLLATLAGGAGAIALLRTPTALPTRPYVGLAATVAALLALTPIDGPAASLPLPFFALSAPWRYALTPLLVHFAFSIGWAHRERYWNGLVIGWYVLHFALFVAALSGMATAERPLLEAIDTLFRARLLEPAGFLTATAALGIALMSPSRRGAQRRATGWALAAVVVGVGPLILTTLFPELGISLNGDVHGSRFALGLLAFLGLAAILALPFVNPINRDLLAYRLAQRVLDHRDTATALGEVADALRNTFEAEGVTVRLTAPALIVTSGEPRAPGSGSIAPEVESIDDRRTLVAPIGRAGDPLGEVRLDARFAGAFGRREREWLAAFLDPLASVLRVRRRETGSADRVNLLQREIASFAGILGSSTGSLPDSPVDDGMAVPPPVDAREVLGQLSSGLDGVTRRGDDIEREADETRTRARQASDEVAVALDALRLLTADLLHLGNYGDEIASSNQSVSGVAFRTNLLANNAALEATRAGTAGKTFGVLAEEIRRLSDATSDTSSAIQARTTALAADVVNLGESMERLRASLASAIRESEAGEDAARRLGDSAAALLGDARALRPALEEAYAVARRRSARDQRLTDTMERFLGERSEMARALENHRVNLDRLREAMERIAN
jgi:hypothetical protein